MSNQCSQALYQMSQLNGHVAAGPHATGQIVEVEASEQEDIIDADS